MIAPLFAEIPFPGWDPVAIHLGPLAVRWYGLGYLAGFLVAGFALDKLGRDGYIALTKEKVSDLIGWLVLSVILGGRLGYALFYEQRLLTHPLELIRIWEGGLSFHGGLLGVVTGSWLFARKQGIAWPRLADALSLAVPFGILFVRCANFINGELYGRVASAGLPWGVRFPTDPVAHALSPELARGGALRWHDAFAALRANGQWAAIAPQVPLRHPSQLYEALLEGAVIAVVLWTVYLLQAGRRADGQKASGLAARPGAIAGLFLVLYAAARFGVEFVRQPDVQLGVVLGPLSMGQVLSIAVAIGGATLMWRGAERGKSGL